MTESAEGPENSADRLRLTSRACRPWGTVEWGSSLKSQGGVDDADQITRANVLGWARDLIDLSHRNHALYHRPTKRSSLDLRAPDPLTLHRELNDRTAYSFLIPPFDDASATSTSPWTVERSLEAAGPDEIVTDRVEGHDLERTLTNLMRTSNRDWLDRAVRTLYVAFGQLVWSEDLDGRQQVRSPLFYLPVVIKRGSAKQPFLLERTDDDPVLNPSLVMKLDESFGIDLNELAENVADLTTMDEPLEQIEELVDPLGWVVEHAAALKRATFHKESMYRDLVRNVDRITQHPIVRSLAGVPVEHDGDAAGLVPAEAELDTAAPPEQAHLVLDADASQRRAVVAALGGVSFVMDGPPGTGKSQTIVNMIAELIAAGRSVLFVSEKAAALEVVAKRLADVGLSDFLLELHSHKANRKEVVQELARAVRMQPQASGGMNGAERARLEQRRKELNEYAAAVNEERLPLARSVVWAAGRVASLHGAPELAVPASDLRSLDLATLETIVDDSRVLASSWDRIHSSDFLWRGVENDRRPGADPARRTVGAARDALRTLREAADAAARTLGAEDVSAAEDVEHVVGWIDLLAGRPTGVTVAMLELDAAGRGALRTSMGDVRTSFATLEASETELERRYPGRWQDAPFPDTAQLDRVRSLMADSGSGLDPLRSVTSELLSDGLTVVKELHLASVQLREEAEDVARLCGADTRSLDREQVERVAHVATLVRSPRRPDARWLDAKTSFAVDTALTSLKQRQDEAKQAWRRADGLLRPEAVEIDLAEVVRTIRQATGAFATFKKETRAARRTLREHLSRDPRDVQDHELDVAVTAWRTRRRLLEEEEKHRGLLGRFQRDGVTDVVAARDALGIAMDVRRAGGDGFRSDVAALQFCASRPEDPELEHRGRQLTSELRRFVTDLERMSDLGVSIPRSATIADIDARLTTVRGTLEEIAPVLSPTIRLRSMGATVNDLEEDSRLRRQAQDASELLATRVKEVAEHAQIAIDAGSRPVDMLATLDAALDWCDTAHTHARGTIDRSVATRLLGPSTPDGNAATRIRELRKELETTMTALHDFVGSPFAAELPTPDDAPFAALDARIERLFDTADQLPEWWDHSDARSSIVEAGLEPQLEEASLAGITPAAVPDAIERALLTAWLEQTMRADKRLANVSAGKRDSRVAEFRRMDQGLLADSAYRVIEACAARMPRGSFGGSGLILREAQKKSRHLPVRTLLERTGQIVTRLKPCLMMSPLSVSQYIPSDWNFDVVIFDEASQIPPQDAINCVYRGSQLIIAGDDRQLPPTSFFELAGNDEVDSDDDIVLDDFESVLGLAKASELLADFGLRWHYRSRHEDLITFSNHRFYEGDLVTYPGAVAAGPALGVKHHLVADGVYQRSGRRDNPREAERVAEIVADHVRTNPQLSIGVVALSSSQAEAIEDAVDRMRREDPRLDKAFRSDRLDGFFVKNLENVQGDDRDIIILSIGYGPDASGRLTMNFGPMNQAGGWRRLNVAVTRARNRMDVVSSIPADRIRPSGENTSLATLKAYLEYAERGPQALQRRPTGSLGDPESPLEEEVLRTIRSWGYDAVPQVGSASYRVDIGVVDPSDPDRYVLGVECDGAAYHSSKVARDRDRLRQQVLEGLGWRLHRVWGPSWFRNRRAAEDVLRDAIARALDGDSGSSDDGTLKTPFPAAPRVTVEHLELDPDARPAWAKPYERYTTGTRFSGDLDSSRGRNHLRDVISAITWLETPLHPDRLMEALRDAFADDLYGYDEQIEHVLNQLERDSSISRSGDGFIRTPDAADNVRYPPDGSWKRPIDWIPRNEITAAIINVVTDGVAVEQDELERVVRTVFGFKRLGPKIATAIQDAIRSLVKDGMLSKDAAGRYRLT